jgi:DNA helicase-2/ATP-dependent DNA helicase PcrA
MSKEFKPSAYQQAFFDWIVDGSGSAIVNAVAGSGKTTSLIEGLRRMDGRKAVVAFNKTIADELKIKTRDIPNTFAMTVHSLGLSTITKSLGRPEIDADKMYGIIDAWAERRFTDPSERKEWLNTYKRAMHDLASKGRSYCIGVTCELDDRAAWWNLIDHYDLEDDLPPNWYELVQWCIKKSMANTQIVDFDDMIYMPLYLNLEGWKYDWVLIDEAQDTNPARRLLAERAMKRNARLVAVGDPHQAIYGFTGASHDALDRIKERFNCVELPLSVCYRCGKNIVAEAKTLVPHIEAFENKPDGVVEYMHRDLLHEAVQPGDAILCRLNAPLVQATFELIRAGKPARMLGRDVGNQLAKLATKWKINKLDDYKVKLTSWGQQQVAKLLAEERGAAAAAVADQVATMQVFLDHCDEEGIDTTKGLSRYIVNFFDDKTGDRVITLSSVHKAKGAEWDTVFLLERTKLMPFQYATKDWEIEQEMNLIYVAVTRAMQRLVYVDTPEKED